MRSSICECHVISRPDETREHAKSRLTGDRHQRMPLRLSAVAGCQALPFVGHNGVGGVEVDNRERLREGYREHRRSTKASSYVHRGGASRAQGRGCQRKLMGRRGETAVGSHVV